jgi:hypothetical protein
MGTEIENVNNELDAMMLAMDGDDNKAIMELTGQAETDTKPQTGLPRLNINYKEEDDNGVSLKRGTWSVWNGQESMRILYGCSLCYGCMSGQYGTKMKEGFPVNQFRNQSLQASFLIA